MLAAAKAMEKSIKKAEEKMQGVSSALGQLDEAADFILPTRRVELNSMSSRPAPAKRPRQEEPYYIKLTKQKRR